MPDWRHAIERRLDGLRLPPAREAEVVEELSQHLDDRYGELRDDGAGEEAARRDALAELDEADLVRELTGVERSGVDPLPLGGGGDDAGIIVGLWQDLRFGARMFRNDAGVLAVVVLTLSVAIAANAIVFGFVELLLLRPLPLGNAPRIVTIYGADHRQTNDRQGISIPDFLELKERSTTHEDAMAMRQGQVSLADGVEPLAVRAAYGTANIFRLWDVSPAGGRLLLPGEDVPGRSQVAVLAHHFWVAHFGSDAHAIGRALTLNGRPYTIVGVMTPEIEIGTLGDIDLWPPLETSPSASREDRSLLVMGLLKPSSTLGALNAELAAISDRPAAGSSHR
jgi:putative ABC transport system permease protein